MTLREEWRGEGGLGTDLVRRFQNGFLAMLGMTVGDRREEALFVLWGSSLALGTTGQRWVSMWARGPGPPIPAGGVWRPAYPPSAERPAGIGVPALQQAA